VTEHPHQPKPRDFQPADPELSLANTQYLDFNKPEVDRSQHPTVRPEHYKGEHRHPEDHEVPHLELPEIDYDPTGDKVAARLRCEIIDFKGHPALGVKELKTALDLIENDQLSDADARDILSSTHVIIDQLKARGQDTGELQTLSEDLMAATYGSYDVPLLIDEGRPAPKQPEIPIHKESRVFEWQGFPIELRAVRDRADQNGGYVDPDATVMLYLGPDDAWYARIGNGEAARISPDETIDLGREDLSNSPRVSAKHLTIHPLGPTSIMVEDRSKSGTFFRTMAYPDPEQFRREAEARHHIAES
jgi:hypothetical protein